MPPKFKSEEEVRHEKEKILREAANIITEGGYESLTIRKLAANCKVSAPKIYYYFDNKDAVYLSVMVEGFQILHHLTEKAFNNSTNEKDRFFNVCSSIFEFAKNYMYYYEIMFNGRLPRCMDFSESIYDKMAMHEKEIALSVYNLFTVSVTELAKMNNKNIDELDIIEMFSSIHGCITLYLSNILKEIDIDYDKLSERVCNKLLSELE